MFQRIYDLATATPFIPFAVVLHSGRSYPVRTADHIFFIRDDEGAIMEDWFEIASNRRVHTVVVEAISSVELDQPIHKQL